MTLTTEIDPVEWDAFVERHPDATGYHLWAWRAIFNEIFGHQCVYIAARRNGQMSGILPLVFMKTWLFGRFGVSVPFVNYGGVVADDATSADWLLGTAASLAESQGLAHLELRHRKRHFTHLAAKQHKVTMLLPLANSIEDMWNGLDRKVRNQIRKTEKAQLEVAAGGRELLAEFHAVFGHNMRDLGIPAHSNRFFEAVLQGFPERTRIFIVRREGQPIGGALAYAYRDVVEVPWASSIKQYLPLCPNNLLYWTIIQQAIAAGARTLDFGRSTPNEGTFHFKRQWGAVPHQLYWEYQMLTGAKPPELNPKNPKFKVAIDAWKHLPVRMANLLGPSLVRGMPY